MEPGPSVGPSIRPHDLPYVIHVDVFPPLSAGSEIYKILPLGLL